MGASKEYMAKKEFPEIYRIIYRGLRAAVAAGIAQAMLLQPDWSDPKMAARTLAVAFIAGFFASFGMWARDMLDKMFGYSEKSIIQRIMPF